MVYCLYLFGVFLSKKFVNCYFQVSSNLKENSVCTKITQNTAHDRTPLPKNNQMVLPLHQNKLKH